MTERILTAGDVHGDVPFAVYLIQRAKKLGVSKIMQVGDFGAWEHMEFGREFFDKVDKQAALNDVTVYFLDGNHDKTSLVLQKYSDSLDGEGFLLCRDRVRYAPRGHRWTWGESRCMAFGGAYSVNKPWRVAQEREDAEKSAKRGAKYSGKVREFTGRLWFPEEEASDLDVDEILKDSSPIDVLFCHDKPRAANPGWNRKDLPECWPNQDRVQRIIRELRPKTVIHGHLHYPYQQMIHVGDGYWSDIIGLDCGQPGYHPGWRREDSWIPVTL